MLYTSNIWLADVLIYIYVYCTYQLKINRYLRALQSVTTDFCVDWQFSHLFRMAAPEATHLELSGHKPACSVLNY